MPPKRLQVQDLQSGGSRLRPAAAPVSGFVQRSISRPALSSLSNLSAVQGAAQALTRGAVASGTQSARSAIEKSKAEAQSTALGHDAEAFTELSAEELQAHYANIPAIGRASVIQAGRELDGAQAFRTVTQEKLRESLESGALYSPYAEDGTLLPGPPPIEDRVNKILNESRQTIPAMSDAFFAASYDALGVSVGDAYKAEAYAKAGAQTARRISNNYVKETLEVIQQIEGSSALSGILGGGPAVITTADLQPTAEITEQVRKMGLTTHKVDYVRAIDEAVMGLASNEGERAAHLLDAFKGVTINGVELGKDSSLLGDGKTTVRQHFEDLERRMVAEVDEANLRKEKAAVTADKAAIREMDLEFGAKGREIERTEGVEARLKYTLGALEEVAARWPDSPKAYTEFKRAAEQAAFSTRQLNASEVDGPLFTLKRDILRGDPNARQKIADNYDELSDKDRLDLESFLQTHEGNSEEIHANPGVSRFLRTSSKLLTGTKPEDIEYAQEVQDDFLADLSGALATAQEEAAKSNGTVNTTKFVDGWVKDNGPTYKKLVTARESQRKQEKIDAFQSYWSMRGKMMNAAPFIRDLFGNSTIDVNEATALLDENKKIQALKGSFTDPVTNRHLVDGVESILFALQRADSEFIRNQFDITPGNPNAIQLWRNRVRELLAAEMEVWSETTLPNISEGERASAFALKVREIVGVQTEDYLSKSDQFALEQETTDADGKVRPFKARIEEFALISTGHERAKVVRDAYNSEDLSNMEVGHPLIEPFIVAGVDPNLHDDYAQMLRHHADPPIALPIFEEIFQGEDRHTMTPERFDLRARTEGARIASEGRTPSSTKKQLLSLVGMRGLTSKEMLGSSVSFRATAAESAALEAIKAELGDLWLPLLTSPTGAFAKTQANERLLNTAKLAENGFDFTNFEAKDIDLMTVKIQDWGDLSVGQQTKLLKAAGLDKSSLPLVSRNQTILNLMTL